LKADPLFDEIGKYRLGIIIKISTPTVIMTSYVVRLLSTSNKEDVHVDQKEASQA
jgi:hypothetical protein